MHVASAGEKPGSTHKVATTPDSVTKVNRKVIEASKVVKTAWKGVGKMMRWFVELIQQREIAGRVGLTISDVLGY